MHKNAAECAATNTQLMSSLRQRCFEGIMELIETPGIIVLNTNDVDGICFVFHAEDTRNSKC